MYNKSYIDSLQDLKKYLDKVEQPRTALELSAVAIKLAKKECESHNEFKEIIKDLQKTKGYANGSDQNIHKKYKCGPVKVEFELLAGEQCPQMFGPIKEIAVWQKEGICSTEVVLNYNIFYADILGEVSFGIRPEFFADMTI
jgi:hypothetical protein